MNKAKIFKKILLLIIFCMPFYLIKVTIFGLPSNVFELLSLLGILLVFICRRKEFLKKITTLPKVFLASIFLILLGVFFSTIFNNSLLSGFGILKGWFLIPIFFSFALCLTIQSVDDVENIFQTIYFSAATVGLIAIVYKLDGIVTYDDRLTAFYSSPNYLAMCLSSGVFFGIYFLFKEYFINKNSKQAIFYILTILFILVPLYFTYSYGAWLAIFLSLLITILILRPAKKQFISVILFILFCLSVLFISQAGTQKFSDSFNLLERSSFASRMMIWQSAIFIIKQNPLLGIGAGNFQSSYLAVQSFFPPYLEWAVPQPHNIFLAFWLQAGLLGLSAFLYVLFFIFKLLWRLLRNKKSALLAAPLLAFFLYTILHGLIDTTYWKNDLAFLFWICVFLAISLSNKIQKDII